jgi:hypothetical protein
MHAFCLPKGIFTDVTTLLCSDMVILCQEEVDEESEERAVRRCSAHDRGTVQGVG